MIGHGRADAVLAAGVDEANWLSVEGYERLGSLRRGTGPGMLLGEGAAVALLTGSPIRHRAGPARRNRLGRLGRRATPLPGQPRRSGHRLPPGAQQRRAGQSGRRSGPWPRQRHLGTRPARGGRPHRRARRPPSGSAHDHRQARRGRLCLGPPPARCRAGRRRPHRVVVGTGCGACRYRFQATGATPPGRPHRRSGERRLRRGARRHRAVAGSRLRTPRRRSRILPWWVPDQYTWPHATHCTKRAWWLATHGGTSSTTVSGCASISPPLQREQREETELRGASRPRRSRTSQAAR